MLKAPLPLGTFTWRHLLALFGAAILMCVAGSYLSYNGPLTSSAWHDWVASVCETAKGRGDGATRGPIIDIVRALLAAALAVFGFYRLEIIPRADELGDPRRLNWVPLIRPGSEKLLREAPSSFAARFGYEKWLLAGFFLLAIPTIALDRPLDFLVDAATAVPHDVRLPADYASGNVFAHIGLVYTTYFSTVTRPYLFPYSLYIFGLWYFTALPVLLALARSVRFDTFEYGRLYAALGQDIGGDARSLPRNIVAIYERKCLKCFEFINGIGKRYALFLIGVFALSYIQLRWLACSVLRNAVNSGKELLLLLSVSSLAVMLYVYLRLHYDARRAARAGVDTISDVLERDHDREPDLRQATALAEVVRKKDGLAELYGVFRGAGVAGIIAGLLWKFVFQKNMCQLAQATLPDQIIDFSAKLFQLHCSSSS